MYDGIQLGSTAHDVYQAAGTEGSAAIILSALVIGIIGERSGSNPRTIIWEGKMGTVEIPQGLTPVQIGNEVEESVRQLVGRATKQAFPTKAANAPGPDLRIPATPPR